MKLNIDPTDIIPFVEERKKIVEKYKRGLRDPWVISKGLTHR